MRADSWAATDTHCSLDAVVARALSFAIAAACRLLGARPTRTLAFHGLLGFSHHLHQQLLLYLPQHRKRSDSGA